MFWLRNKKINNLVRTLNSTVNLFHSGYLQPGTMANSEGRDEMSHNVAFHHRLPSAMIKTNLHDRRHYSLESLNCDPLKYKMGNSIFILAACMRKSIRIKRVNRSKGLQTYFVIVVVLWSTVAQW